ncbi:MAG: hypothetical protein WCE79_25405 [Xanthobacteraceae bacterium]
MYRMLLIAWVTVVMTASVGQAQTISAACAERDLQAITFIEQRGEAGDLPATALSELGLMHMRARRSCTAGQETMALAIYDDILGAVRTAERVRP